MQIAIVGLPRSGKTTVFNALTRGHAPTGGFGGRSKVNVGVARVPDERIDTLAEIFEPRRPVYAEATCVDPPGPAPDAPAAEIFSGEALTLIQQADALLHVVRAFEDESVPHPGGSVDWRRDVRDVAFDLLFADIALIDRRIERINATTKGMRASERADRMKEIDTLKMIQSDLEDGTPLRAQELNDSAHRVVQDTFLVSALPYLLALNIAEADLGQSTELGGQLAELVTGPRTGCAAICGKLEMELAAMAAGEEAEFRASLGAGEPGLQKIAGIWYEVLDLISFLTIGNDEVRAWTIPNATPAVKAAGKVHSDIERGFIRAEVVRFEELVSAGGLQEARRAGVVRSEGRDYPIQDGDVVKFLFSV